MHTWNAALLTRMSMRPNFLTVSSTILLQNHYSGITLEARYSASILRAYLPWCGSKTTSSRSCIGTW